MSPAQKKNTRGVVQVRQYDPDSRSTGGMESKSRKTTSGRVLHR